MCVKQRVYGIITIECKMKMNLMHKYMYYWILVKVLINKKNNLKIKTFLDILCAQSIMQCVISKVKYVNRF